MLKWLKRHFFWLLSHKDFKLVPYYVVEKNPCLGLGKCGTNILLKIKKPIGWEHLVLLFPKKIRQDGKMLCLICNAHKWRKAYVAPDGDIMRVWEQSDLLFVPTL